MTMRQRVVFGLASLLGLVFWVPPRVAQADVIYQLSMDTSGLIGASGAPYSLAFDFVDGDGVPDNTVQLGSFHYHGGSGTGSPSLIGGASGDLEAGATLTDSTFYNSIAQTFQPGSSFDTLVGLTTNFAGGSPDALSVFILDSNQVPIATNDPTGNDALLLVNIQSDFITSDVYQGIGTPLLVTDVRFTPLSAPVPEPHGYVLALPCVVLATWAAVRGARLRRQDARP